MTRAPHAAAMAMVSSVDSESTTKISSAQSTDSHAAPMFSASLKEMIAAVIFIDRCRVVRASPLSAAFNWTLAPARGKRLNLECGDLSPLCSTAAWRRAHRRFAISAKHLLRQVAAAKAVTGHRTPDQYLWLDRAIDENVVGV